MNQAIYHGCNWNGGDVPYIDVETVLHRDASTAVAIYCFGLQKTQLICGLLEPTVIDITQLGCPQLADKSLPAISCNFGCHKFIQVSALRTANLLTQWLNFHILSLQYAMCPPQRAFH